MVVRYVISNQESEEWPQIIGTPLMASGVHHAHVMAIEGDSLADPHAIHPPALDLVEQRNP